MEGMYRVAAAVPMLKVADVKYNVEQMILLLQTAAENDAALVLFPELSLTGYTCGDLFFQQSLLKDQLDGIETLRKATEKTFTIVVAGAAIRHDNRTYNCAVIIQRGQVMGIVPKIYIPNYKEFYEKRWFSSGADLEDAELFLNGDWVPFGTDYIFEADDYFKFGVEICEDLWAVIPPSSHQSIAGTCISLNLSASNELVAKSEYRRDLVTHQSARCVSAYIYSSSGVGESTTDLVFGGHAMIAENGLMLEENERFQRKNDIIFAEIDCQKLMSTRVIESSYPSYDMERYNVVSLAAVPQAKDIKRFVDPHPFVPSNDALRDQRCEEIFNIQSSALAKRFDHTGLEKAIIGISGGLDSTLALLVCCKTMKLLGKDNSDIIAVTMPGYGTSDRTYENAVDLCKKLGTDFREVSIVDACDQHFKDIGHDPELLDITYQNVQARERTQILMNMANKHAGLVIGTGDLSEMALGWCTYNGDHMSMYAVNNSVPKTLIKYLVKWAADQFEIVRDRLLDILDTPITPELLPTDKEGAIAQHTEKEIGPFELHDFFLYHVIKYGAAPSKVLQLAELAYKESYSSELIEHWLTVFYKRFFSQQFKRSCIPDGPKVGSISLSPRGDWRMPSDAVVQGWLDDIDRGFESNGD
ncbi:MAG: NAD(+) synthase [Lentisphaeria bacterium]|nr:NAD(+) synthase [Lentisphaeria bacterium]NQZ69108.1 NAD(+) synthase [Lentisphaeria bacterium]